MKGEWHEEKTKNASVKPPRGFDLRMAKKSFTIIRKAKSMQQTLYSERGPK